VLGLAPRLILLWVWPAVHGGDSVVRLARADTLVLAYQLPLPQALVMAARALDPDPRWARLVFCVAGAAVAAALGALVGSTAGRRAGLAAGVLAAVHPLLLYYSLVPYQEPVFLLTLLLGALALRRGRDGQASLWLGLACLCRYEAWPAAALALFAHRRRPLRGLALFGWAPLAWLAVWQGLSPAGTYVLDVDPQADRAPRLLFLLSKLHEYTGVLALGLALAGIAVVGHRRLAAWGWGAVYLVAVLTAVAWAGHEFPPGTGRVSERLVHLPALAVCALAGLALAALSRSFGRPWLRTLGTGLATVLLLALSVSWTRRSFALVEQANADPSLRLAAAAARWAGDHLPPRSRLAVAAPLVPPEVLEEHAGRVARGGGDAEAARAEAQRWRAWPPDRVRLAAHLPRRPGTVVLFEEHATDAALVAVYDDAPGAARFAGRAPLWRERAGPRGLSLYAWP
jgi:hypothetical protein